MGDKRGLINGRRPNKLQYIKIVFDVRGNTYISVLCRLLQMTTTIILIIQSLARINDADCNVIKNVMHDSDCDHM